MPIFEYVCADCDRRFEALVQGSRVPQCPSCHGVHLEKQLSVFAVTSRSASTMSEAMPAPCGRCGDPRGAGACSLN
jgi:putative FmdB family regulatory protein